MQTWKQKLLEKNNDFITPIIIEKDNDYRSELKKIYSNLEKTLIKISADDFYVQETKKYKKKLISVLDKYYSGYISEAQKNIDQIINEFDDDNTAISNINNSISFGHTTEEHEVDFFRARCNDKFIDYKEKEMLHIPFSKRSMVKTERFSIPGLPCLYLGTSSYVCWIELGKPADHMFNVSPIKLDNTQKIFNLAINFKDFCHTENNEKTVFRLLLLSIATSFRVKEDNRVFKSEYILSQLIMLSCMKKGLSGIAYYSKQVDDDRFAYSVGVNLVLFASYSKGKELSKICNHIYISKSFNYSMYKNLSALQTCKKADLRINHIDGFNYIGNSERMIPYKETLFYDFDNYLHAYLNPKKRFNET